MISADMEKDFDSWNILKQKIDKKDEEENPIIFKERDVWWCSIGLNIGHEENGKNEFYTRPILVVRKFSPRLFLGVPLTTQVKENKYYYQVEFLKKTQCVMLSQIRVFESKRMRKRMGELPSKQLEEVRKKLANMILGI